MIYLTGDTHGGIDMHKLSHNGLKRSNIKLTENAFLIITGDFGFPFTPDDIEEYERTNGKSGEYVFWIKWFRDRPYKVLFIDGNHDNHDWWAEQPVTEMFGGRVQVHPHAENVIHLMRGEVYTIEGQTFFTFGGAVSVDKAHRREGYSWWSGEQASDEEIRYALDNLEKADFKVDHIITHTLPRSVITSLPILGVKDYPCKTAEFLDEVLAKVQYDKWFCGHFHIDNIIADKRLFVLYQTVHRLDEFDAILNGEKSMYSVRRGV